MDQLIEEGRRATDAFERFAEIAKTLEGDGTEDLPDDEI